MTFYESVSPAGSVEAIRHLIAWPEAPTPDWQKGFLAGIFDAEGSYSQGVFRIANTDPEIISRTAAGDFIANGVVSHNCFARNTHTHLDLDAGQDFNSKVVVKVNAPELLRRTLASARWAGEHIAMGTNVDCYQRAEGRYQLMRGVISALRDHANPFSILTKGTLILRDLDLLTQAAEVTDVWLNVSAPCTGAAPTRRRITRRRSAGGSANSPGATASARPRPPGPVRSAPGAWAPSGAPPRERSRPGRRRRARPRRRRPCS